MTSLLTYWPSLLITFSRIAISCDHKSYLCLSTRWVCGNSSSFLPLFLPTTDHIFTLTRPLLFGSHPVRYTTFFAILLALHTWAVPYNPRYVVFLISFSARRKMVAFCGRKPGLALVTFLSANDWTSLATAYIKFTCTIWFWWHKSEFQYFHYQISNTTVYKQVRDSPYKSTILTPLIGSHPATIQHFSPIYLLSLLRLHPITVFTWLSSLLIAMMLSILFMFLNNPVFFPFLDAAMLTISAATDMCETIGPFCDSVVVLIQGLKKKMRDLFVSIEKGR